MALTATTADSIGKQLLKARTERGLTIEDIAFQTHIPVSRVNELENDDYSNFANSTYAKGFLKIYSSHLGFDLSECLNQFGSNEFSDDSGHKYVHSANAGLATQGLAAAADTSPGRSQGIVIWAVLLIGLGGVIYWLWTYFQESSTLNPMQASAPANNSPPPKPKIVDPGRRPAEAFEPVSRPTTVPAAPIKPKVMEGAPPAIKPDVTKGGRPPASAPSLPAIHAPSGKPFEIKSAIARPNIIPDDESASPAQPRVSEAPTVPPRSEAPAPQNP